MVPERSARSRRRSSISKEVALIATNFTKNLKEFIVESGVYSVCAVFLPLLSILFVRQIGLSVVVEKFYGSGAVHVAPVLSATNVTVAPFTTGLRKAYYCQSSGTMTILQRAPYGAFWIIFWASQVLRSWILFKPTRTGLLICATLATAVTATIIYLGIKEYIYVSEHGEHSSSDSHTREFPLLVVFFTPLLYTVAYSCSRTRQHEKHTATWKALVLLFFGLILEPIGTQTMYQIILPAFFRESTSTMSRFLIRSVVCALFTNMGIEVSWQLSRFAAKNMGADMNHAVVSTFAGYGVFFSLLGRIMQGSAETVEESLLFEVAGTLAELAIADALLKSRTPIGDVLQTLNSVFSVRKQQSGRVTPDDASSNGDATQVQKRITRRSLRGQASLQRSFCETCMFMLTISEATSLLVSSLFWLLMDANPNVPGSPKIPVSQTLKTLVIMLIGELFVTDGIVAYVSNKFEDRYVVDLASAWKDLRTNRKHLLWLLTLLVSLLGYLVIFVIPRNLCYTSNLHDEANWALTSCPDFPKNITEMARVSAEYQLEWEKYN